MLVSTNGYTFLLHHKSSHDMVLGRQIFSFLKWIRAFSIKNFFITCTWMISPHHLERSQFYLSSFRHMSILTEESVPQNSLLSVAIFPFFSYPIKTYSLNIILPFILCLYSHIKAISKPFRIKLTSLFYRQPSSQILTKSYLE